MTPTPPRKVRSGRRQFGPSPGTDQEWAKVMASPHVQRAFQDPAVQQALMQHMQASAAAPDAQAPPPVGMARGGPAHFDTGGLNAAEINELTQQIADPSVPETRKNNLRMRLATLQAQQSQAPGALALPGGGTASADTMGGMNQMVKPPTLGNTALAAGMSGLLSAGATSHQGMSALLGAGLGGALSYLIRKYGKNAQKPGSGTGGGGGGYQQPPDTTSGTSGTSSTGATTSQSAPSVTVPSSGPTGGPESVPGLSNVGALPSPPPSSGASLRYGTANSPSGNVVSRDGGKTWTDTKTNKEFTGPGPVVNQQDIGSTSLNSAAPATTPSSQGSADTTAPPPPATAGTAAHPGLDFMQQQQERLNRGLIRRGPANQTPEQDAAPFGTSDLADLPMQSNVLDPSYLGGGLGLAGGGPVPEGPPSGLRSALAHKIPVPVLHTTIVISAKPKKKADEKPGKKAGGKAQLLPPKRGPQDHEDRPRTHGRVQVPRGSGAAIKGKRFGGIF